MLDTKNIVSVVTSDAAPMQLEESSTAETIAAILGVIRRQFLVVASLTLIGAVVAGVVLFKAHPKFTATTTLLINTRKIAVVQQSAVTDELPVQAVGAMESQVELIRSDEVAVRVLQKLKLIDDPRFNGEIHSGLISQLFHILMPNDASDTLNDADRQNLALNLFKSNLVVERLGVTYAVEIKFQWMDPILAAQVANAVAEAYVDLQRTSEYDVDRRATDWLEQRIPELRAKSEAAQGAVVDYKREHNIVETSAGKLIEDQRLADVNGKLNAAQDETLNAKAQLDQISAGQLLGDAARISRGAAVGSDAADTSTLEKLRSQYLDNEAKLAQFSSLGANYPGIVGLRNQQTQLRVQINAEVESLKKAKENDYAAAQQREANLRKDFDVAVAQSQQARGALVKLQELEAAARAYQDLYATYVTRYNASLQQAASPIAEATIITPATPLIQRDYKKSVQMAALLPLAGLMLGLAIALGRETLADRVLITSSAVQSRLRIACLGVLPKVRAPRRSRWRWRQKARKGSDPRTIEQADLGIGRDVVEHPFSHFSEGVRSIKFAIDLESRSRSAGAVVGITSALANEGKSTVALAVAQMIASNGSPVVLVDCDLRNPSLTRSIAPTATAGIAELAFGKASLEQVVWKDPATQMAFVPAISHAFLPDPLSRLSSAEMRRAFETLRAQYPFVIVDLSPLVPVIDVCATIDFIDAYVLVIEWRRTTIDIVKRALRAAPPVTNSMIGAVLNKADLKSLVTYDPYVTGYYLNSNDR